VALLLRQVVTKSVVAIVAARNATGWLDAAMGIFVGQTEASPASIL
jgi:hypothetical protein